MVFRASAGAHARSNWMQEVVSGSRRPAVYFLPLPGTKAAPFVVIVNFLIVQCNPNPHSIPPPSSAAWTSRPSLARVPVLWSSTWSHRQLRLLFLH